MRSCSAKFRVVIPQAGAKTLLANLPAKPVIRLVCGLSLLFCVLLLTTGCGGSKRSVEHVNVTGKVTYNGKPVTGGQIMFVSKDGFASTGRIDENGNYTINAPLGEVKITVDNSSTVTVLAVGLPPWRREVLGAAIPVVDARLLIAA
jgi:hypothetical protein